MKLGCDENVSATESEYTVTINIGDFSSKNENLFTVDICLDKCDWWFKM